MHMSPDSLSIPNIRRRLFRLSLWLLVPVIVIGIFFGWSVHEIRQERRAIEAIENLGGEVANVYGSVFDVLRGANYVSLVGTQITQITDENLLPLTELKGLEMLYLSHNKITDSGLVHLKGLTKLKQLDLKHNRQITDAGLAHLEGLVHLDLLVLYGTQVSSDGARKLQQALPNTKIGFSPDARFDANSE